MPNFFETRSYWHGGFTKDQQDYYKEHRLSQNTSAKQVIRTGSGRPLEPVLATGSKDSVLEGEHL